jgi:hypothetical protein
VLVTPELLRPLLGTYFVHAAVTMAHVCCFRQSLKFSKGGRQLAS